MSWKPYELYSVQGAVSSKDARKLQADDLPIEEPPCKQCIYFDPHRRFARSEDGFTFDGIVICSAREMYADFSCFRGKEPR